MAQIFPIDFEEKLTMAQDDYILFSDSEDGNKIKKAQYKNLKGEKGDPGTPGTPGKDGKDGKDGADGTAATITVGSTTTGTPGSSASVTNSGTSSAAVLDFTIPQGAKGEPGEDGQDGADGASATITVGTTTTLPAGSSATVTNVGTSQDAILNFGIPKGDQGVGSGDVVGPASSTDGHLALFDGATGKLLKDGGAMPTIPSITTISVTLTAAGWSSKSQTVSATGVTASNIVIVSPDPSDIADYSEGGVYCSSQSSGTLTFACDTEPTNDIDVNVVIIN